MRIDFDWDPAKAASNAVKHGVTFEEAMTVFRDPLARSILDPDHGAGEERWIMLGEASTGNLLVVVHGPIWTPTTAPCASFRRGSRPGTRRGSIAMTLYREELWP